MIGGIDLGGTKIEARAFDDDLVEIARHRIATPTESYQTLLDALAAEVTWLDDQGEMEAIGLGSPGLINPNTGEMLTANLPATGHRLGHDLAEKTGRTIALINDSRAAALSEALVGAGRGARNVVGLAIGTGLAGGHVIDGRLVPDNNGQHGEYGHLPLPAEFVVRYDLPLVPCGCGLTGCFETYLSGPGLSLLAETVAGQHLTPEEVFAADELRSVADIDDPTKLTALRERRRAAKATGARGKQD